MENLKGNNSLMGSIMEQAAKLNQHGGVDVYFCLQGNTGCVCLTIEENKTQAYQRREFATNTEGLLDMLRDILKMIRGKERQDETGKTEVLQ